MRPDPCFNGPEFVRNIVSDLPVTISTATEMNLKRSSTPGYITGSNDGCELLLTGIIGLDPHRETEITAPI